ncbi:MAG: response regulator [Verrucomicrobia bacterium]|nr:response regulator [Verrucomicrobiota bacterium]
MKVELGQSQPGLDFRMPPVKKGLWQNYTLLDGIRNDDVRDLLFDRDGMLWLATWGGALRFDGVQWTQYTKEEGLSDNRVNALARDAKGNLWLATENGVSCLTNRVWRRFFKADGLADDRVRALAGAPDGSMWFGTARGASRFDGKAWQKIDPPSGLGDEDVNCILREPDGAIWFGTSNGALRYEEGRWRNVFGQHGLAPHAVYSIHRDSDGTLWFGESGSVARYDGQAFTRLTTQDGLLPGVVHSILRDSRGVLWFGANNAADLSNGGVTRWDGRSVVCLSEADGLAGSGVRSIRQTPDGAVWFATDGGVSRYDENTFRRFTTQDGLPNNAVSRLQSFSDGTLWFWRIAHGSDEYHWPETDPGDGISRYDGRSFFSFTVSDGLAGNHVQTIGRDPSGEIWITGQGGVSRFDGKRFREPIKGGEWGRDGGISLYQDPEGKMWIGRHNGVSFAEGAWVENFSTTNVLANQHVSAIHRDNDGTLWFATLNQGIWRYDGRGFTNFSTEHGLPSVRVCSIDRAGDGTLWFRTGCGFARFDRKQFSAITCTQGLTDDRVNALHIDPDGTVWAGTAGGGVNRWQDGQVTTFTATRSRLAHDKVNAIYRDAQGVLWFGTDGGVSRYNGIGWSSLDERDGLAGNRVNAIAQDASGAYWFATDKGLTRYQPDTIQPNPPRLTIGTGETATPGEPPSVLAGRLVRFEFHAADLSNRPQNRKYRFQIQPGVLAAAALSQTWQPATDASQIEWTTNKAGAYTFAVQYLDRDLRLSDPAIATLTIVPPWYLNAWIAVPSGAGVLALLSSSLVLGLRYYAKRKESLKLREAMFIQEHRAREALESKNVQLQSAKEAAERAKAEADRANRAKSLFLANMSHEIRTPMNAILGYAEILQNDPSISPKQDHALETIRKSGDHLLALIDEILDLSKIEAGKMELHLSEFDLHGWVKDVAAIFEMRSRHKQLAWCLELLGEPEPPVEASAAGNRPLHSEAATPRHPAEAWERGVWVRGDAVKLGQVLMNLLANAVKFTETGSVSLKVTARPASEFVFEVIDTGRGIPPEKHSGLFRPFGQADQSISADGAGLGLAISKQKLDLMGGTLRFESTSGQGSRFWFSLTLPASVPRVLASSMNAPKRMRRLVASCQVRALVVDDLPDNRDVLCEILSSIGCRVASASNGREAVMSVRTFRPDIVFMDIRLPDMDGFQATREIQQEFGAQACKIVSFSGSAMDHERQAYLDAGFDDFLAKPLRAEMICETLKRLLNAEFEPGNGAPDMHADATRTGALSTSASYSELIAHLKRAAEESNATKVRACLDSLEQMGSEGKRLAEPLRAELGRYDFAAMRNRILVLEARALNQPPEHEAGNQTI